MVDGITGAFGGSFAYPALSPHQHAAGQTTSIAIATEQDTAVAQVTQGGSQETLYSSRFSASITISIGSGTAAAGTPAGQLDAQTQKGAQALATVKQTAAEARDFLKNDAGEKLQIALNELKLLKLLGNSVAGAKEAAQLAKQIAAAATEYAQGGGSGNLGAVTAGAADTTGAADASTTTAGTAPVAAVAGTTAPSPSAAGPSAAAAGPSGTNAATTPVTASGATTPPAARSATAPGASALTAAQQDPFYQTVDAALAALKKYLQKTLPALEASSDKKTRKTAKEVEKSFNESVAEVADAEAAFNIESSIGSGGQAALGGADTAASAAAAVVAGAYQPVNISA